MKKIVITGYSSSGKSTFAQKLAQILDIPLLHIDTIRFLPGWAEAPKAEVEAKIRAFMKQDAWIIDGSHRFLAPERFSEAEQIFIFKMNRFRCLYQAFKRRVKYHNKHRDSLAEGCYDRLNSDFLWWILVSGRKRDTKNLFKSYQKAYPQKTRSFYNHRETKAYIEALKAKQTNKKIG